MCKGRPHTARSRSPAHLPRGPIPDRAPGDTTPTPLVPRATAPPPPPRPTAPASRPGRLGSDGESVELGDRLGAGLRDLAPLDLEVVVEEALVVGMLVEVVRGEDRGEDRHAGVELDAHQAVDDRLGDEI